jgi:hypothetical protein
MVQAVMTSGVLGWRGFGPFPTCRFPLPFLNIFHGP